MIVRRHTHAFGLVVLALLTLPLLVFATRPDPAARNHSATLYVFGTLVEVIIRGEPPSTAQRATDRLAHRFHSIHRNWHAWKPGELERLNAALAQGDGMAVSADLLRVLQQGQHLSQQSNGLFNPAIGQLIAAWGFHADDLPSGPPPDAALIAALVARAPSMSDLRFDGAYVSSTNPAVQLDLGAYAKGAALDLAVAQLARDGIRHAVLNAGGDVRVMGRHAQRPWTIAIRDPFGWEPVAVIAMKPGEALFTSGNYERFLSHDQVRFSHIIDPRTGWPAGQIVSVSVVHENGALADAAATALSVAGPQDWAQIANRMGVTQALLIDDTGTLHATPDMAKRLSLRTGPQGQTPRFPVQSGLWPRPRFPTEYSTL